MGGGADKLNKRFFFTHGIPLSDWILSWFEMLSAGCGGRVLQPPCPGIVDKQTDWSVLIYRSKHVNEEKGNG